MGADRTTPEEQDAALVTMLGLQETRPELIQRLLALGQDRDEARAVARQLCRDARLSLGEEYAVRYPWLEEGYPWLKDEG